MPSVKSVERNQAMVGNSRKGSMPSIGRFLKAYLSGGEVCRRERREGYRKSPQNIGSRVRKTPADDLENVGAGLAFRICRDGKYGSVTTGRWQVAEVFRRTHGTGTYKQFKQQIPD